MDKTHPYFAWEYNESNNTCYFFQIYIVVTTFKTLDVFSSTIVLA